MKAFTIDNQGRVICDQCGDSSPRIGTMTRQTEWQRHHRQTCPLKRSAARRSTSNANVRGSAEARRKRKKWLVEHWRANEDVVRVTWPDGVVSDYPVTSLNGQVMARLTPTERYRREVIPACRCWECGTLLTADTVVADRIVPGCQGGTYRRENLRPHCTDCSEKQGGRIGQERRK